MFKFLIFIFFLFILLLFLMGFSVIRMFKNVLFGKPKQTQRRQSSHSRHSSRNQEMHNPTADTYDDSPRQKQRRKIFSKDEGEYVDYEEVK